MNLRPWPQVGGTIQTIIDEIRLALQRVSVDPLITLELTSGTEVQRDSLGSKPVGFIPISAVATTGEKLAIASWSFNSDPRDSANNKLAGMYGITVTFVSGTTGTVTGRLVGA